MLCRFLALVLDCYLPLQQTAHILYVFSVSILKGLASINSTKPPGTDILFVKRFLITTSVSLFAIDLFSLSSLPNSIFVDYVLLAIYSFPVGSPICWHIIVCNSPF